MKLLVKLLFPASHNVLILITFINEKVIWNQNSSRVLILSLNENE